MALLALIDNKDIKIKELMKHIPGPDFPTGGVIIGKDIINKVTTMVEAHLKLEVKESNRKVDEQEIYM